MKDENKMEIEEDKKIDAIEQSVEKAKVRQDILCLIQQWLVYRELRGHSFNTFRCLTLPGKWWYFEHGLSNGIKNSFFMKNKPEIHFDGVESKRKSSLKAFINMPENSTLVGKCFFDNFLKYNIRFKKNGFGMVDYNTERQEVPIYDFIWPDYCGEVSVDLIVKFATIVQNNINEGMAAITVKLNSRHKKARQYIGQFKKYSHSKNLQNAIEDTINVMLRKYTNKDTRCVYSVVYSGGKRGGSTMLTMVYSVNIPKKAIISVKENRREGKSKTYGSRYQMAQKLANLRSWNVTKAKGTKVETKMDAKMDAKIDKVVYRLKDTWKPLDNSVKIKIASKFGISVRSFGARVAHYHGKFKNKKGSRTEERLLKAA